MLGGWLPGACTVRLSAVPACLALPPHTSGPRALAPVSWDMYTQLYWFFRVCVHTASSTRCRPPPSCIVGAHSAQKGQGSLTCQPTEHVNLTVGVVTVPSLSLVSDPVPRLRARPDRQGLVLCTRTPHLQGAVGRSTCSPCRPCRLETELRREPQPGTFFFNF